MERAFKQFKLPRPQCVKYSYLLRVLQLTLAVVCSWNRRPSLVCDQ